MGVAVALALAPLTVRGQEVESVRDGHRPRHALLVIAHVESGRGLLTATALGVEALGRDVIGLDPRIDTGRAVTALGESDRGLLTATAPAVASPSPSLSLLLPFAVKRSRACETVIVRVTLFS